jgi:type I restriction enzyme M protein
MGYGDYVEQITYLIFLKMADEREVACQLVNQEWGQVFDL